MEIEYITNNGIIIYMSIDNKEIRKKFKIYEKHPELVYFDSAATSLTPSCVVDTISNYYNYERSTVNRGESKLVNYNNQRYEQTREKVAKLLNCDSEEVIFSKSTTSIMNHLATNIINSLNDGDEIITTDLEHHSSLLPFREKCKDKNINFKIVNSIDNKIDLDYLFSQVSSNTKVVVIHHVSNVIGDSIDLNKLGKYCQEHNIISVVDGAQGILHEKVDVKDSGIDFYVFSAHKIFGPTGLGVMYGNKEIIKDYYFDYGGDMAVSVDSNGFVPKPLPHRLEGGTPNIAEVLGFNTTLDFINNLGIDNIFNYSLDIRNYCLDRLKEIKEVEIYNSDIKTSTIIFNIKGVAVHDALAVFAKHDISLRGGQMCNALSLEAINQQAVLRASFNIYNNYEDVDKLIKCVHLIIDDPLAWM